MVLAGEDDDRDRAAGDRAPDRQAAAPDLQRLERIVGVQLVVGDHVVEPRADHAGEHDPDRDLRDLLGIVTHALPPVLGQVRGRDDTDREREPVEVQRQRAEVEDASGRAGDEGEQGGDHRRSCYASRRGTVRVDNRVRRGVMSIFSSRPPRIEPGAGQESVWDYPRPPRLEPGRRASAWCSAASPSPTRPRGCRVLETSHPPNYYFPPRDVLDGALEPAKGTSFCEWKGRAHYFTVHAGDLVAPAGGLGLRVAEPGVRADRRPRRVLRRTDGRVLRRRRARHRPTGRVLRRLDHVGRRRPVQGRTGHPGLVSRNGYFTRRDIRRSARTLPPVWHVGQ